MSPQASSIAWRRGMNWGGWRSYTFQPKMTLLGLEMENMVAGWVSTCRWSINQLWTKAAWNPIETYVVPDDNKPGLLWPFPLVVGNEDIMQGVKKGDHVGGILRTKSGMMMDTVLTNGCTHCDFATTLSRDIDYSAVSYEVSSPASGLGKSRPHQCRRNHDALQQYLVP
jgi:hypothetical protein